ncbi:MAG: UDP-2,3-diacylglucosamine diphosphatase LpxI [Kiritimatiellae bacterium]|nr:UDP-2,3-diacylglucosamine diphosphatase LpxI [Kiritimatiellia bacterium]
MSRMRILWILNGCGLESRVITGGPVRFHEVSRRFAGMGFAQHLMTTRGGDGMLGGMGCALPRTVVPASFFLKKEPCRPFRLWSYFVTAFCWRFFANRLPESDVAFTASDYFCDVVPAIAIKRRTGAKWIAWIHHCETDPKTRPGNRLVNELTYRLQLWSFRRIARHADAAWISDTLAGDEIEQRLLAFGMPAARIRRMWDGIDHAAVTAAPEPAEKTSDCVMIGVRPNKGLHDVVPVWREVLKLRPGTTLTLMGGMSGEAELVKQIADEKLPISVFKAPGGFLPAAEYHAKIKEARVLFAPSHEEGWGIAVCEAMAAGLPVVAYDLPAYRKIYKGAYAPVPLGDFKAFAKAIVKALDDAQERDRLRAAGAQAAAKYDWGAIAARDAAALRPREPEGEYGSLRSPRKIVVVSGSGEYPRRVVEGARAAGVERVDVLAVRGSTARATRKAADFVHEIGIGEIASGIDWMSRQGYDGAILAGQINPLSLFRSRFDAQTRRWLAELPSKNAHTIFGKLVEEFEKAGVPVLPASCYMDGRLPGAGLLTERAPDERESADVEHASRVAQDVGVHDVGQTVLVKDGMVLAVEAFEGTNAAIRRGGKLCGKGGVVFKAARIGHDMRFDIPVAGLKTLKTMRKAGMTTLAFQAGRLVLLDREAAIRYANAHGIAILGVETCLPPAPLRPY